MKVYINSYKFVKVFANGWLVDVLSFKTEDELKEEQEKYPFYGFRYCSKEEMNRLKNLMCFPEDAPHVLYSSKNPNIGYAYYVNSWKRTHEEFICITFNKKECKQSKGYISLDMGLITEKRDRLDIFDEHTRKCYGYELPYWFEK